MKPSCGKKGSTPPGGTYQSETTKVLIVGDDPGIREMLTKMMMRHGYQTEIAAEGFEAGVKVMEFKPGLIILDLIIPGIDGFEVCRKIKGNPGTSHIRVLAVSGYVTAENRDRIMEAGADCYLPKPIKSDLLLQHKCFDRRYWFVLVRMVTNSSLILILFILPEVKHSSK